MELSPEMELKIVFKKDKFENFCLNLLTYWSIKNMTDVEDIFKCM